MQPRCMFYGHSTVITSTSVATEVSFHFHSSFLQLNDYSYLLDLNKSSVHVSSITATSKLLNINERVDDINVRASNRENRTISFISVRYIYLLMFPPSKAIFFILDRLSEG